MYIKHVQFTIVYAFRMQHNKFNVVEAQNMSNIVIIGKRATGKTSLVQDLIPYLRCRYIDAITPIKQEYMCVSYSSECNEYNENYVDNFVKRQRIQVDNATSNTEVVSSCIIFDDCLLQNSCFNHNGIKALCMNSRCMKVTTITVMQCVMSLPNSFTANLDYIFIFGEHNLSNRRRLYQTYAYIFPTFKMFCDTLDDITREPYTCMVINMTKHSNDMTEKVFWYKADPPWQKMMSRKKQEIDIIREELIQRTWHPSRLQFCLDIDEINDIYPKDTQP
jgi:hypothetical protein